MSQFFFALAEILSDKNQYFAKHLFAKQELITCARLRGQDFATAKNFSFNQCHTKSFAFFFLEKSPGDEVGVCIAGYKHSRRWENSPNPFRVYIRL